ncbi:GNAT family N-acetyltransferase [Glutamicibacter sp. 287]|uniref:GNAT family N-acetyltransferase n=1 Tax=unclassified Glutamicibacter TaxID=2627139 RepID=UPI001596D14F|nr:GNAT family N-acetyltransferase [Glutamicibacter sp. BW80]
MMDRQTQKIVLEPLHEGHRPFVISLASDERVTRYIGDGSVWDDQTIGERIQLALSALPLATVGATRWFVAIAAGHPAGLVVATRKPEGVELGYWVSPGYWGQGIAGAMVNNAIGLIPELFQVRRLIARVDPANVASAKLLARRGFTGRSSTDGLDHYELKLTSA